MVSPDLLVGSLAAVAFAAAAAAFALFVFARRDGTDYDAYADARGWDHQTDPDAMARFALPAGFQDPDHYLAGPGRNGPFRCLVKDGLGTAVWIGTPANSAGLRIRSHAGFRRHAVRIDEDDGAGVPLPFELVRRFHVEAADADARRSAAGPAAHLLCRPRRDVALDWHGTDLWVTFPVQPDGPEAAERLVRFADALAGALMTPDEPRVPRAHPSVVPANLPVGRRSPGAGA